MLDKQKELELQKLAKMIRLETMKAIGKRGFGHVGGSMSIVEVLAVLYGAQMNIKPEEPNWVDRDWFVLSKGHSGPALYATLALKGYFNIEELDTLNLPGTNLPSHCDRNKTIGIDMSTGSLGQGISTAIGIAMGNKMDGRNSFTYLILGDGESQEGQVWEGALFAAHHRVGNLIAFIDYNKKQLDGYTKDICDLGDIVKKFEDFNWHTQLVDGHDIKKIFNAIENAKLVKDKPSMIVLDTVKGKGCSFAESILFNHHMRFTQDQVSDAIGIMEKELEKGEDQ